MVLSLAKKLFGTVNDRYLSDFWKITNQVNNLEETYKKLSDTELKQQTNILKEKYQSEQNLDKLLPEAYAVCREAAKRVLNLRHFDVQILGGIALHQGMIAEMRTGEGKTLVCTLPVFLNALTGKGVHVVTVNDYLANRDASWMGEIYEFLGLSVGCITSGIDDEARKEAYNCDVTYGTNNEFGFDYLRDNLKLDIDSFVQRELNYAIIDEVDSILIDEARTPLIISGPAEDSSALYKKISTLIPKLSSEHYEIDEKSKTAMLTDNGNDAIEKLLKTEKLLNQKSSLYDVENIFLVHHINQALKALYLFQNDVDYIVKDDKVMIIDEFTGRIMDGRRYSDGLHQALEAKENVTIQKENQTLASITFQNYFRNYHKLAGMTGTASTEAAEFSSIYNLNVVEVPTHMKENRKDNEDIIFKNLAQKYKAIVEQIKECHDKKQPVLVGTVSIEKSELLAKLLKKEKFSYNVLNAKHHAKEAHIIAQAGRSSAITIATNMAGRGTDIMLGGNPEMMVEDNPKLSQEEAIAQVEKEKAEVLKAGGLYVLSTERHESRRIDNQLRGRSGRQGDPGESKFFLSLEDDLMRIFGSEKMSVFLHKLGFKDDESIHHPWITRALEKAQKKVEAHNFEIRKNLLKYDDVINEQRHIIYSKRKEILEAESVSGTIEDFINEMNQKLVAENIPPKSYIENWDLKTLDLELHEIYGHYLDIENFAHKSDITEVEILDKINKETLLLFQQKKDKYGEEIYKTLEKNLLVMTLDSLWKEHLNLMDHLKTGINLRAYGQKDPLNEYKKEAFEMFEEMLDNLMKKILKRLAHAEISMETQSFLEEQMKSSDKNLAFNKQKAENMTPDIKINQRISRVNPKDRNPGDEQSWGKVGRNELCPCGSNKKYKHCHGAL